MIPAPRTQEELKRDFSSAILIRNCPGCGETCGTDFSRRDMYQHFTWPFGPEWPEVATGEGYCPACDAFIEAWGRNAKEGKCEVCCRLWRWNQDGTAVDTKDALFEYPKRSERAVEYMTQVAKRHAKYVVEAKWRRGLTGPHFVRDDKKFTVCIPKSCAEGAALEEIIKGIRNMLRRKRAARFKKREELPDRTELHFDDPINGSYHPSQPAVTRAATATLSDSRRRPAPETIRHRGGSAGLAVWPAAGH